MLKILIDYFRRQKVSRTVKLLRLMKNWKQYSNVELENIVWWRFGSAIHELKKKWVIFEKERKRKWDKNYIEYWRVVHIPSNVNYYWKRLILTSKV